VTDMSFFYDAAKPADFVGNFEARVSRRASLLVIAGLSAASWALLAGVVMALSAAL